LLAALDPLLADYAARRREGERFGDFLVRTDVVRPRPGPIPVVLA
jgi:sulfite reductase beta subunit-like hemoprotein